MGKDDIISVVKCLKVKVIIHESVKYISIDSQNYEVEIEENSRVVDLIKRVGIQSTEDIMIFANETLISIDSSLKDIKEIKIYPMILGG